MEGIHQKHQKKQSAEANSSPRIKRDKNLIADAQKEHAPQRREQHARQAQPGPATAPERTQVQKASRPESGRVTPEKFMNAVLVFRAEKVVPLQQKRNACLDKLSEKKKDFDDRKWYHFLRPSKEEIGNEMERYNARFLKAKNAFVVQNRKLTHAQRLVKDLQAGRPVSEERLRSELKALGMTETEVAKLDRGSGRVRKAAVEKHISDFYDRSHKRMNEYETEARKERIKPLVISKNEELGECRRLEKEYKKMPWYCKWFWGGRDARGKIADSQDAIAKFRENIDIEEKRIRDTRAHWAEAANSLTSALRIVNRNEFRCLLSQVKSKTTLPLPARSQKALALFEMKEINPLEVKLAAKTLEYLGGRAPDEVVALERKVASRRSALNKAERELGEALKAHRNDPRAFDAASAPILDKLWLKGNKAHRKDQVGEVAQYKRDLVEPFAALRGELYGAKHSYTTVVRDRLLSGLRKDSERCETENKIKQKEYDSLGFFAKYFGKGRTLSAQIHENERTIRGNGEVIADMKPFIEGRAKRQWADAVLALEKTKSSVFDPEFLLEASLIATDKPTYVAYKNGIKCEKRFTTGIPGTGPMTAGMRLTWVAEGGANASKAVTPHLHWPGGASGVTIGRGYDMRSKDSSQIRADLKACGVSDAQSRVVADAAHLHGKSAAKFASDHPKIKLTPAQEWKLFQMSYKRAAEDTQRIYNNVFRSGSKKGPAWHNLDYDIRAALVDLRFRGDYVPETRSALSGAIRSNSIAKFATEMMTAREFNAVPENRHALRLYYCQTAVADYPRKYSIPGVNYSYFQSTSVAVRHTKNLSDAVEEFVRKPVRETKTKIVLHHTVESTLEGTVDTLKKRNLSYHFLIDRNGKVYGLHDPDMFVSHVKGDNPHTIGVSLVGGTAEQPITKAQLKSTATLCRSLKKEIPSIQEVGHHRMNEPRAVNVKALARTAGLAYGNPSEKPRHASKPAGKRKDGIS